jgi:tRNA(Ile2) C34 agmatinyltransferase TiaS
MNGAVKCPDCGEAMQQSEKGEYYFRCPNCKSGKPVNRVPKWTPIRLENRIEEEK